MYVMYVCNIYIYNYIMGGVASYNHPASGACETSSFSSGAIVYLGRCGIISWSRVAKRMGAGSEPTRCPSSFAKLAYS